MTASIAGKPLDLDTIGLWGIDIAHHQGTVDFGALEAAGCGFVIVKATEGQTYIDPKLDEYSKGLQGRGMVVGFYHFARVDTDELNPRDAELEAQHFAQVVADHWDSAAIPWLDAEVNGSLDSSHERFAERNAAWAVDWIAAAEAQLKRTPGVYTGRDSWQIRWNNTAELAKVPLWQADHGKRPWGKPEAMRVEGWRPLIHQISGRARVPGITTNVDLNVMAWQPEFEGLSPSQIENAMDNKLIDLECTGMIEWRTPARAVELKTIMPEINLAMLDPRAVSTVVKLVQGLLIANDVRADGLLGPDRRPDGKPGPMTRDALAYYRRREGLGDGTMLDGATWHRLLAVPVIEIGA